MTKQILELKFPIAINIEGATEDQYNKIYDILLQAGLKVESKDFSRYVTFCGCRYVGLTPDGFITHYLSAASYGRGIDDSLDVYTAEEFLTKFSDNKDSLKNLSKNTRKRPNVQRSSSKCVVYYTDGSSYTLNNFQNLAKTDATVIIEYVAPERKVVVEHGVLITELSSHKSVEIDKEHLAGIVIKQQNGEDRVIRYSHLFASKQYVANQKNKMKAWSKRMKKSVERDNVYANVLGDYPSEDGQSEDVQSAGYKLADGTYSSQYKIGDKFIVVINTEGVFTLDSVVSLYFDDDTSAPLFKLEDGACAYALCDGKAGAYLSWSNLEAYKE